MSSILKALKKLEEEKSTRKPETLKLPAETAHPGIKLKAGLAILLFMSGGAATYFYLHPDMTSKILPATDAYKKETLLPLTNSSPANTSVKTRAIKHAAPLSPSPDLSDPAPESRAAVDQKQLVRPKKKTSTIADHVTSKKLIAPAKESPQTVRVSEMPPATASLRPLLNVDGIAFQEGADIVAMINGIQATKSSVIEGAKIEAILKDRVLFSFGSDHFEVLLGRSSR